MAKAGGRSAKRIREVCDVFVAAFREILREDLVAVYFYGAAAFSDTRSAIGDLDFHVIVRKPMTEARRRRIRALHSDLAKRYPGVGDDMDVWFITEKDARGRRPPRHLLDPSRSDGSWALHRAHWLAGRYVLLHGATPSELCKPPSWPELRKALRHEFRFVEDLIPHEHTNAYCVLNLSRILYSVQTRNVVVTKPQAAQWALRHLPRRYRRLILAARRVYKGAATDSDRAALRENTRQFLSYARDRMRALLGTATDI